MTSAVASSHKTPSVNDVAGGQRTLGKGAVGKPVEHVQRLLNHRGASPKLAVDGDFGPKTEAAVKKFQSAHHLKPTGRVDHETLDKLEPKRVHHKDEYMKLGDRGANVKEVEANLKKLGYDPGAVDGTYDADTAKAVVQFKHDEGIKHLHGHVMTGAAQQLVRRELRALDHAPLRERLKKDHPRLDALTKTQAAREGGIGEGAVDGTRAQRAAHAKAVKNVKAHLESAGFHPKSSGGHFDERTATAVRAFQRKSGLDATGRVDSDTWRKLQRTQFVGKTGTSPAQSLGEKSNAVLHTERALQKAGYKHIKADGIFDKRTENAVKHFEEKHHLTENGKVSARDLKAIENAGKPKFDLNSVKGCAQFLLHSKNVSFWTGLSTGSDRKNFERLARGQDALVQTPDFVSDRRIKPSLSVMKALVHMAKQGPFQINALTGGDHSSGSKHYFGIAVDVSPGAPTSGISRFGVNVFNEGDHLHLYAGPGGP